MIRILAGDIGATHCRFALYCAGLEGEEKPFLPRLLRKRVFPGRDFPDGAVALRSLFLPGPGGEGALLGTDTPPDIAVLAPAGPILAEGQEAQCSMPNLPWRLCTQEVRPLLGLAQVYLINDLAAQAYACLLPEEVDAVRILAGDTEANAAAAVLAAGTGLGKALFLCERALAAEDAQETIARLLRARVLPSEGGHADFPFVGEDEFAFARFAAAKKGRVRLNGDDIVSGSGLALICSHLSGEDLSPQEAVLRCAGHPRVLEWYARFYGRACRNYALDALTLGGIYISGGMALRVGVLEHPAFAGEFYAGIGPDHFLRRVPLWHIRSPEAGLFGAALYGFLRMATDRF
ncbi:MAG: glucokinase [Desulfovibrio sp.]|jgi:glucokinase|nr:glucokinase [Desulfovibrio sp.]